MQDLSSTSDDESPTYLLLDGSPLLRFVRDDTADVPPRALSHLFLTIDCPGTDGLLSEPTLLTKLGPFGRCQRLIHDRKALTVVEEVTLHLQNRHGDGVTWQIRKNRGSRLEIPRMPKTEDDPRCQRGFPTLYVLEGRFDEPKQSDRIVLDLAVDLSGHKGPSSATFATRMRRIQQFWGRD